MSPDHQLPFRAEMVDYPEKYFYFICRINVKIKKDNLADKEENPVFLDLGNTMGERANAYKEFAKE